MGDLSGGERTPSLSERESGGESAKQILLCKSLKGETMTIHHLGPLNLKGETMTIHHSGLLNLKGEAMIVHHSGPLNLKEIQ